MNGDLGIRRRNACVNEAVGVRYVRRRRSERTAPLWSSILGTRCLDPVHRHKIPTPTFILVSKDIEFSILGAAKSNAMSRRSYLSML